MADDFVVDEHGQVLTPAELAERRAHEEPPPVHNPPDTGRANELRTSIERGKNWIRILERRREAYEAEMRAHPAKDPDLEEVDSDWLKLNAIRIAEKKRDVAAWQREYKALTGHDA